METRTDTFLLVLFIITIIPKNEAFFNADELKYLNYEIDIVSIPVKSNQEIDTPILHMTSKYGQQYQCQLPEVESPSDPSANSGTESEIPNVEELLKPLGTAPCLLKPKDWWTYEFCYGKYIRQYHIEEGQISGTILTLGNYDQGINNERRKADDINSRLEQNRFHSQFYSNGSTCDLTGLLRSTEVRFYCEPDAGDYIARVDEPETCHYIVTIHTSRICSHPHLKPLPTVKPHTILCNPVLTEERYTKYLKKVEDEKEKAEAKHQEWVAEQQLKLEEIKVRVKEQREKHNQILAMTLENQGETEEIQIENDGNEEKESENNEVKKLENMSLEMLEKLLKEKTKLQESVMQHNDVIKEAEEFLQQEIDDDGKDLAYGKLVNNLNKLIDKLLQAEKDMATATEQLENAKQAVENVEKKNYDAKTIEDEIFEGKDSNQETETEKSESSDENRLDELDDVGNLRVRIRRMNSEVAHSNDGSNKLQWFRHKNLDAGQKQKLEDAVKEKLEQAGLDTNSRNIEVKIITAGYYDDEDGKDFHVLSDEETQQFQKMIWTLLTKSQEARKDIERQNKLEQNYQFKWNEDETFNEEE